MIFPLGKCSSFRIWQFWVSKISMLIFRGVCSLIFMDIVWWNYIATSQNLLFQKKCAVGEISSFGQICIWICCFHWTSENIGSPNGFHGYPAWLNGLQCISDWKMSTVEWNWIMNFECVTDLCVCVWQRERCHKYYKTHIKKSADSFMHKQLIGLRVVFIKNLLPAWNERFHPPSQIEIYGLFISSRVTYFGLACYGGSYPSRIQPRKNSGWVATWISSTSCGRWKWWLTVDDWVDISRLAFKREYRSYIIIYHLYHYLQLNIQMFYKYIPGGSEDVCHHQYSNSKKV